MNRKDLITEKSRLINEDENDEDENDKEPEED